MEQSLRELSDRNHQLFGELGEKEEVVKELNRKIHQL
jgi:hypothetical protein